MLILVYLGSTPRFGFYHVLYFVFHLFYVLVDYTSLKADLQIMLDQLGSDPTEAACEAECHKLLTQGHVLNYGCPLVCHA